MAVISVAVSTVDVVEDPINDWYSLVIQLPVRGSVSVKCHDCVTGTERHFNRNSGRCRFCQYQEI